MLIERPAYLNKLIAARGSDQVKVVTGIRRCGKSYMVFRLFKNHLLDQGVPEDHIVEMAFDRFTNRAYRNPAVFYDFASRAVSGEGDFYLLLDEVQLLDGFAEVLNDFIAMPNVDVYVTGSNARLLSRDVVTEFRGRAHEIALSPLTFTEFMSARSGDVRGGYQEFLTYGSLPAILSQDGVEDKVDYLERLYDEVYVSDIVERNGIRDTGNLEDLIDVLASNVGSLTNAARISATFKSEKHVVVAPDTVERYITCLEDAFLVKRAKRYDLKGRRYIGSPYKLYFTDLGLRNARLNFRQLDEGHLMENAIYNELVARGYGVDVGCIPATVKDSDGKTHRTQLEVDFVCNKGSERLYVQSAFKLTTREKALQETRPLERVGDNFRKVLITADGLAPHFDERGILRMSVYDFLLNV